MRRLAARLLTLLVLLGAPAVALAVSLSPRDILLVGLEPGGTGAVFHVDPVIGAQVVVSSGLVEPYGIAVDRYGRIFVTDVGDTHVVGDERVLRIDPATGSQTVISTGGLLRASEDVLAGADGSLFVLDRALGGCSPGCRGVDAVIRVDPATGAQTIVSSGVNFVSPFGVAVSPTGDIFVADANAFGAYPTGGGGVIKVDPLTGAQTVVSAGGLFENPTDVGFGLDGNLYVVDVTSDSGSVIRVNPVTGEQTRIVGGGASGLARPLRLAIVPEAPVPEPSTLLLVATGLAGLGVTAWRRARRT